MPMCQIGKDAASWFGWGRPGEGRVALFLAKLTTSATNTFGGVHSAVLGGLAGADVRYFSGCSFGEGLGNLLGSPGVNAP